MISVIIPTLNAEATLAGTLASLVPAAAEGLIRQVIIVDGGSADQTLKIVDAAGAELLSRSGGRGYQLAAGANRAQFSWLLFLHADTVLEPGWEREAAAFIDRIDKGECAASAASFRFALDDLGSKARMLEALVAIRCALLRLPYGDQGFLLPKRLYDEVGGYRSLPLMEDVDLVRRLGRRRVVVLRSRAVTSAARFRHDGYVRRSARNVVCLVLYYLRVPTQVIHRIYG
jgi:rSAM/selenodomain-associated transferase 2